MAARWDNREGLVSQRTGVIIRVLRRIHEVDPARNPRTLLSATARNPLRTWLTNHSAVAQSSRMLFRAVALAGMIPANVNKRPATHAVRRSCSHPQVGSPGHVAVSSPTVALEELLSL
jgi:hypothetical protein